jgi:hypothetical protein
MDRRRFVLTTLATTASLRSLAQAPAGFTATVVVRSEKTISIPENFVGLSFETQQLSDPSFFSAGNTGLVARFRELAPHGVLRLGGNTSDYGYWKPTPTSVAPPRPKREYKMGDPPPDLSYGVTPEAVRNLRAFLDATGWTCLYGINFGNNTPELAADEADFATRTLGSKLEYLQVGNEADRFASTIRDPKITGKPWNADAFLDEWLTLANAIVAKVPDARFGMPDIASNAQWFSVLGDRLATAPIRSHIVSMTHHYYIGGPPSNPQMTPEHILQRDPKVARDAGLVRAAAEKLGTHWRMTEGNTCYRGGKPGVSDVFAAALWSADYLLQLASFGYSGVNLHGGDGQLVANSVGGKLPGDELVKDDPARHPHPYYTPIAHIGNKYIAEPVSFGMRFAQHFAGAELIPVSVETGGVNASVYMARTRSGALLGVINKDATKPFKLQPPTGHGKATEVETTSGASYTATEVRVEGAKVPVDSVLTVAPCSMALFNLRA